MLKWIGYALLGHSLITASALADHLSTPCFGPCLGSTHGGHDLAAVPPGNLSHLTRELRLLELPALASVQPLQHIGSRESEERARDFVFPHLAFGTPTRETSHASPYSRWRTGCEIGNRASGAEEPAVCADARALHSAAADGGDELHSQPSRGDTYILLLAGIGLMGTIAHRRSSRSEYTSGNVLPSRVMFNDIQDQ